MAGRSGPFIVDFESETCEPSQVGGKSKNLWRLSRLVDSTCAKVPSWFCITTEAFNYFVQENGLSDKLRVNVEKLDLPASTARIEGAIMRADVPALLREQITSKLAVQPFRDSYVAVRSSGTDEDSASHSFAGQFDTFLFQRGVDMVLESVKRCWCSCFSERVMSHRVECGMSTEGLKMAVVIQVMVNSASSGVAFSRHPLKPLTSDCVLVEAVYGLGEGLVGGELVADRYEVSRSDGKVSAEVEEKTEMMVRAEGGGVEKVPVAMEKQKVAVLLSEQVSRIGRLLEDLEEKLGTPQDFEWAYEGDDLYCLQTRPVVTLPPSCFFNLSVPGKAPTLWDNSNIVESYSGVTSPLTFSFASYAYEQVYTLTLLAAGVPASVVKGYKLHLQNMLGLVRGNIYYNLMNWYRCLTCIPVGDTSKFMETMMGVKQSLDPELEAQLGRIRDTAPKYGLWTKMVVVVGMLHKIYRIDSLVDGFFENFNKHYSDAVDTDFYSLSLTEQVDFVRHLYKDVLGHWEVPIYNDTYVMLFFGLVKKLVARYLADSPDKAAALQNDLLCGQGDVESTEPTKMLMKIAEYVDTCEHVELRAWFLTCKGEVLQLLGEEVSRVDMARQKAASVSLHAGTDGLRHRKKPSLSDGPPTGTPQGDGVLWQAKQNTVAAIQRFLAKYGFRCINELKLEESTLHDDPGFVIDMVAGYVRTKSYSVGDMEKREVEIRSRAEELVRNTLRWPQRVFFNWALFHARRAVRHRENLRFSRTKLFGVFRTLFRAIGHNLVQLHLLKDKQDVFYLTVDEICAFVDGRAVTTDLAGLVELRRREYDEYRKGLSPPERFMLKGACGPYFLFPQLLDDLNLLKQHESDASLDPNVLRGTPCCPGVVEGVVRVVTSIKQTEGLNGEILVTAKTDPGWVPLYPLCSGLVIERGSLLSHSAVVARELGLPTIVGVSGGLLKRLQTGMKVRMDGAKGTVTILGQDHETEDGTE